VARLEIDHGDVVETRYTSLVAANDPNVVVLRPDLVPDAVERENVYFLRRHKDGQLCDGHLHDSLEDARACTDRTKLDALWQDLARINGDIQRRVNAEFAEYRNSGGTLGGDEWLEQRNKERQPPKKPAGPRLPRMAARTKGVSNASAGGPGPLPDQRKGEIAQAVAKAALSLVPIAGGPLAELVGLVLQPAIGRRRDVWLGQLETAIEDLQARLDAPSIEELSANDLFVTVVLNATQAALRTHQKEKVDALRIGVINAALPMAPGEQEQLMFIRLIDQLTPLHLQILRFMRDPADWFEQHKIPKPEVTVGTWPLILVTAFPGLAGDAEVFSQVMSELVPLGLTGYRMTTVEVSQQELLEKLTTPLGDRFLAFITAPSAPGSG